MAIILRGKRKGEAVEIHQFCNDWFSLKDGTVVRASNLLLTGKEALHVNNNPCGEMFHEYKWVSPITEHTDNRLIRIPFRQRYVSY